MDKDALLAKITEIGTCEDQDSRLGLLTELSDGISQVYDNIQTDKATIDTLNSSLSETKEKLIRSQEENMKFFLRLNSQKSSEEQTADSTGIKDTENHKRKFEDLFKEGGN